MATSNADPDHTPRNPLLLKTPADGQRSHQAGGVERAIYRSPAHAQGHPADVGQAIGTGSRRGCGRHHGAGMNQLALGASPDVDPGAYQRNLTKCEAPPVARRERAGLTERRAQPRCHRQHPQKRRSPDRWHADPTGSWPHRAEFVADRRRKSAGTASSTAAPPFRTRGGAPR